MCSVDSGKNFQQKDQAARFLGGDFPRPTTTHDGSGDVLFVYIDGTDLKVYRMKSCANGSTSVPGVTYLVESFGDASTGDLPPGAGCSIAGLDRCTLKADHGIATDETSPQDVYVVYVRVSTDSSGTTTPTTLGGVFYDVILAHSSNGGIDGFPDKVALNDQTTSARQLPKFMPAVSATRGRVNVSWYDRGAAPSGSRPDTTVYVRATAVLGGPSMFGGVTTNTLVISDPVTPVVRSPQTQQDPACLQGFQAGTGLDPKHKTSAADLCRDNVSTTGVCLDSMGNAKNVCLTGHKTGSLVCQTGGAGTPPFNAQSCTAGVAPGSGKPGACPNATDMCIADPNACPAMQTCVILDGQCLQKGATTPGPANCDSRATNLATGGCPNATDQCVGGGGAPTYGDYTLNASAGGRFFTAWASGVDLSGNRLFNGNQPITQIFADSISVQPGETIGMTNESCEQGKSAAPGCDRCASPPDGVPMQAWMRSFAPTAPLAHRSRLLSSTCKGRRA